MNFLDIPLEVAFKLITMSIRQQFFMLKPSYYNSWGNPYLSSKFLNTHLCTIKYETTSQAILVTRLLAFFKVEVPSQCSNHENDERRPGGTSLEDYISLGNPLG